MLAAYLTGTLLNVATVLGGTLLGTLAGGRLPEGIRQRVLAGLGLVTLVIGVDSALAWNETNPLFVLGGVILGGIAGEAIGVERRLEALGDQIQAAVSRGGPSRVSEGFVTASLLFCVGPLTVLGSIEEGLTDQYTQLATKAVLDGFASIALAAALGWGVGLAAVSVLVIQGAITLGAGAFDSILQGETLAVLTSAGGILIIGIALKLLDVKDVKVGNFLPALIFAPGLVGIASLF